LIRTPRRKGLRRHRKKGGEGKGGGFSSIRTIIGRKKRGIVFALYSGKRGGGGKYAFRFVATSESIFTLLSREEKGKGKRVSLGLPRV